MLTQLRVPCFAVPRWPFVVGLLIAVAVHRTGGSLAASYGLLLVLSTAALGVLLLPIAPHRSLRLMFSAIIVFAMLAGSVANARRERTAVRERAAVLVAAVDRFVAETGDYPPSLEALVAEGFIAVLPAPAPFLSGEHRWAYNPPRGDDDRHVHLSTTYGDFFVGRPKYCFGEALWVR